MLFLIINIVSWFLAAVCKAVMDKLQFHYDQSVFYPNGHTTIDHEYFWNPKVSWRNKYKGRVPEKGERFLGSTTIFVFVTDAWHLFQFLFLTLVVVTIVTLPKMGCDFSIPTAITMFIGYRILFSATFEVFFRFVLKR